MLLFTLRTVLRMHISAFIVYDTRIYIQQSLHLYIHSSFVPFNFRSLLGVFVFVMFLSVLFWFVFVNLLAVDDAAVVAVVAATAEHATFDFMCSVCSYVHGSCECTCAHVYTLRYDTICLCGVLCNFFLYSLLFISAVGSYIYAPFRLLHCEVENMLLRL